MPRTSDGLRRDAIRIWQAGLDAVRSERLVAGAMRVEGGRLCIGDEAIPLDALRRIAVVGAGKAGAGMAAAVEEILGPALMDEKQLVGWVNVPADTVRPLRRITLHAARPPGVNEPRPEGAAGAEQILHIVGSLGPDDLCLCLISGGGSALLPAPAEGVSLDDIREVTRYLSAAGANIEQLNAVRKPLDRLKAGGLARACRAGRLVALIISDVLGDPLEVIASGPTVEDSSTPREALRVLDAFAARNAGVPPAVFEYLEKKQDAPPAGPTCRVTNLVIGNNAAAVDAAGAEAERLGYEPALVSADRSEGLAEDVGRHLTAMALRMRDQPGPNCLVSGGEPVVELVEASRRGLGGRNQQLVLAALENLADDGAAGIALLSGGTDGEDGPTDAAGAVLDAEILARARQLGLDAADYLARNDAYNFFRRLDALLRTGPTGTNVCDVRVVCVEQPRAEDRQGSREPQMNTDGHR
jgi:glycerate 2-kinase